LEKLSLSEIENLFKLKKLREEKRFFIIKTTITILVYIGLSSWLNAVRTTAPIWFVWVLAIIQILFYFLIFLISYNRLKECGYKKLSYIIILLAILGRFENWEIIFIPILVILMFSLTFFNNTLSLKEQEFYNKK